MTLSSLKRRLAVGGVLAGLAIATAGVPAFAQTTTAPGTTAPTTTAPTTTTTTRDYVDHRDRGFDWGWLGLLGLAGLYGLTGKRRDYDTTTAGYRGTADTTVRRS